MHLPNNQSHFYGIILLSLGLLCVLVGVKGLIEHLSPQELDNVIRLVQSFWHYLEYHIAIIIGALIFVYAIWQTNTKSLK